MFGLSWWILIAGLIKSHSIWSNVFHACFKLSSTSSQLPFCNPFNIAGRSQSRLSSSCVQKYSSASPHASNISSYVRFHHAAPSTNTCMLLPVIVSPCAGFGCVTRSRITAAFAIAAYLFCEVFGACVAPWSFTKQRSEEGGFGKNVA